MSTYENDDEALEAIKKWWKENGKSVIAGLVVGISGIVGFKQWTAHQESQSQSASDLYQQMISNQNKEISNEFYANGSEIVLEYSNTPYASLASLAMAKKSVEQKKYDDAINNLNWLLSNSNDEGVKHIARIRTARLLVNVNKIDQAYELVKNIKNESFKSEYNELRGDILVYKKEFSLAREAYRAALSSDISNKEKRSFIEMKLYDISDDKLLNTEES